MVSSRGLKCIPFIEGIHTFVPFFSVTLNAARSRQIGATSLMDKPPYYRPLFYFVIC